MAPPEMERRNTRRVSQRPCTCVDRICIIIEIVFDKFFFEIEYHFIQKRFGSIPLFRVFTIVNEFKI